MAASMWRNQSIMASINNGVMANVSINNQNINNNVISNNNNQ
jgi:hypothetical protein